MPKRILIVDDEPNNLKVLRQILKDEYQLMFALNGLLALNAALEHKPHLILLDIMLPDMSGYDVCKRLKSDPLTQDIPVIFVSSMREVEDEAMGFDVGAVDFFHKPVSAPVVLRRVQTHLSLVRAQKLEESHRAAVFMLGTAGHYNDTDTGVHIWRMSAYSRALAKSAGWSLEEQEFLEMAAPMHDTGKIGIPDSILKAPRKLTPEEWEIMQTHTVIGAEILRKAPGPIFNMAAEIAHFHHEKWDGSGYPEGLAGRSIPESARIVAIADVFDALTMERPYKQAWTEHEALMEIKRNSGSHFDPELVEKFEAILPEILAIKAEWGRRETQLGQSEERRVA